MGVGFDFSDVPSFFEQGNRELDAAVAEIGDKAVEYAKANGTYKDSVGKPSGYVHLRQSNTSRVENHSLILENGKEYASNVESKGYDVLSGAALYAQRELKNRIG